MTSFDQVSKVLQIYFDALYDCDTEKLARAFHPKAIYATADEAPLLHRWKNTSPSSMRASHQLRAVRCAMMRSTP